MINIGILALQGNYLQHYNASAEVDNESCVKGNINLDSAIDIADIILIVSFILYLETPTEQQQILSDYNSDGEVNITDVVLMVIYILEQ